jgi:hypothetical protein
LSVFGGREEKPPFSGTHAQQKQFLLWEMTQLFAPKVRARQHCFSRQHLADLEQFPRGKPVRNERISRRHFQAFGTRGLQILVVPIEPKFDFAQSIHLACPSGIRMQQCTGLWDGIVIFSHHFFEVSGALLATPL